MTARIVPENPTFTTTSEREVWESLRDTLSEDDVLVANLRHVHAFARPFLVVIPGLERLLNAPL